MALLPEMDAFLKRLPPAVPIGSIPIALYRQNIINASSALPRRKIEIGKIENIKIQGPESQLPVRVYTPVKPNANATLSTVVFFHGGGWIGYNIDTHDAVAQEICAASNCVVFSVEYRLAPEFTFPALTNDAYAAVQWVYSHAAEHGANPQKLAVAGDSAGANLAIASVITSLKNNGPKISAQFLIYPPSTMLSRDTDSHRQFADGYMLTAVRMDFMIDSYVPNHEDRKNVLNSPLLFENMSQFPPTYVLTAEYDPLKDDGRLLAEKIQKSGVDVTYVEGKGLLHGFANMSGFSPSAAAYLDAGAAWLKTKLA